MSDGITDARRDQRMSRLVGEIVKRWYLGKNYEKEVKELEKIPRGYYWPNGRVIAKDLCGLFERVKKRKLSKRHVVMRALRVSKGEAFNIIDVWEKHEGVS